MRLEFWLFVLASWASGAMAEAQTPVQLSRDQLGGPERSAGAISPDGAWLAYVGDEAGVANIFLSARGAPAQAEAVTHDRGRGVRNFWFAYDNRHLLFTQDHDGDENDQVFALDLRTRAVRALTPSGRRAVIDTLSPQTPDAVLVMANDRDERFFDPVRIDIASGRAHRLYENSDYAAFAADRRLRLRLATQYADDGSKHWFRRDGARWRAWMDAGPEDALTSTVLGFAADNRTLLMDDSRASDRAAIVALDVAAGGAREIASDPRVDLATVMTHPRTGAVQAVLRDDLLRDWVAVDPAIRADLEVLRGVAGAAAFEVASRTLDDRTWVVRVTPTDGSARTYIYDRPTRRAQLWYEENPAWRTLELQPLHAVEFESRDGLRLTAYYMLPPGADTPCCR